MFWPRLTWVLLAAVCLIANCLPTLAFTPSAPENRVLEIFSIGYDDVVTEATDLRSRTETSTSNYDTPPIQSAAIPMQKRMVLSLANKAGIGLDGIKISINRQSDLIGRNLFGQAFPSRITLFPDAFSNSETLIRTLAHERTHIMQYEIYGFDAVKANPGSFEKSAFQAEESFIGGSK